LATTVSERPATVRRLALPAIFDLAVVVVASFLVWRPLLGPEFLGSHDGGFHLLRLIELDGAIRGGALYPRLAPNLASGYDYPVFNYYGPLSVYLAELFKMTGLGYIDSIKATFGLAVIIAGCSMRLLAGDLLPRPSAVAASLAYVFLPYLLLDIYVRGALAETLALALLPLLFWAVRRVALNPSLKYALAVAVSLAGLVLVHNITALLSIPFVTAFWLLSLTETPRLASRLTRATGFAMIGVGVGLGLSAFYWLSAIFERELIQSERLYEKFFDYHNHFQSLGKLIQTSFAYSYDYDYFSGTLFRAGMVQIGLATLGLILALRLSAESRRNAAFWGIAMFVALSLLWTRSALLWESMPLVSFAQFPWRYLSIVGISSSILIGHLASVAYGASLPPWENSRSKSGASVIPARGIGLAWLGLIAVLILFSSLSGLSPGKSPMHESDVNLWTMQRRDLDSGLVASTIGEYLPRWADPLTIGQIPPENTNVGDVRLTVLSTGPLAVEVNVVAERPAAITFDRFFFPGWFSTLDDAPVETRVSGPRGLLSVDVPAGDHRLKLFFGNTPVRSFATGVSALTLIALLVVTGMLFFRRRLDRAPDDSKMVETSTNSPARFDLVLLLPLVVAGVLVISLNFLATLGAVLPSPKVALTHSHTANFGSDVRLAGVDLGAAQSDRLGLTLFWQARRPIAADYSVALRLLDSAGNVVGERTKAPHFGLRPSPGWAVGQLIRDHQEIALRPGVPAGEYELVVGMLDQTSGAYLRPDDPVTIWDDGLGVSIGKVTVPAFANTAPRSLDEVSGARFDDRVVLERYQLSRIGVDGQESPPGDASDAATIVAPGDHLRVQMVWRALRDLDDDNAVFTHLLDFRQGLLAQDDEWPRRGLSPTSLWLPGQIINDEYKIAIPKDASMGMYNLNVGFYRRSDFKRLPLTKGDPGPDRLSLGTVKVVPDWAIAGRPPPVRQGIAAEFDGGVSLLGFNADSTEQSDGSREGLFAPSGGKIALTLFWQARERLTRDYTVFIHAIDANGALVAQVDGQPGSGGYPTSIWDSGEIVTDRHVLTLPPGLPVGTYRLAVGMYLLETGERLRISSGQDWAPLGELTVTHATGP
jgi:hypothetical protein